MGWGREVIRPRPHCCRLGSSYKLSADIGAAIHREVNTGDPLGFVTGQIQIGIGHKYAFEIMELAKEISGQ